MGHPAQVCLQALVYTVLWCPVDPEVEDQLAQETTVVQVFEQQGRMVRPPCGYGLLQAKEEARKVQALHSIMAVRIKPGFRAPSLLKDSRVGERASASCLQHCARQLCFLMLVLMVNYQDSEEQRLGRLLHSSVRQHFHAAPSEGPNFLSVRE